MKSRGILGYIRNSMNYFENMVNHLKMFKSSEHTLKYFKLDECRT